MVEYHRVGTLACSNRIDGVVGDVRLGAEAIDGDDVIVRWDDGDSVTWSRKEAARRVVKEAPSKQVVKKKPARRQPVVRPALVDVDDLLERDVRIQRTSKPRQARFERRSCSAHSGLSAQCESFAH